MGPVERFVARRPAPARRSSCSASPRSSSPASLAWREVPVEAFPDLTNNQVVVVTEAPGLAAIEVEQRVTYPIETALMGTPGADRGALALEVRPVDDHGRVRGPRARLLRAAARHRAAGRGARAASRRGSSRRSGRWRRPSARSTSTWSRATRRRDGRRRRSTTGTCATRLRSVPGVSEVNSWGGLTQQYHVIVDPRQLEKYGLTLRQVVQRSPTTTRRSAAASSSIAPSASPSAARASRRASRTCDAIVLDLGGGRADPASATSPRSRVGPMPRQGAVTRDGKGESVAGMVIMLQGRERTRRRERASRPASTRSRRRCPPGMTDRAVLRPDAR